MATDTAVPPAVPPSRPDASRPPPPVASRKAVRAVAAPRRLAMPRAIMALILREMSTTYGRSPGGYIWAVVEPAAAIALFSFVISFITRSPALGENFPLFFASGMMTLTIYQDMAAKVGQAIRYSRQLLSYPTVTYVDAILARAILSLLTQLMVSVVIIGGVVVIYDLNLRISFGPVAAGVAMAAALGFSVGLVNCYLMAMFPLWQFIWAVLNRPMFIVSGVLYLIDPLPAGFRDALLLNPVAHAVMEVRRGIYSSYDAVFVSETYVYLFALVAGTLGMLLLHRFHRIILDEGA